MSVSICSHLLLTFLSRYFNEFSQLDFAKAGHVAEEDIILPIGDLPFAVTMLDQLRKLGLIVEVNNGKVVLRTPFTIATAGEPLTPEQAKILVHLNQKIITFSIRLISCWEGGEFEEY